MSFSIFIFISCRDNKKVDKDEFRIIDDSTCTVKMDKIQIHDSLLFGQWSESLIWILKDSCWQGVKSLNYTIDFSFSSTKKFKFNELFTDTTKNNEIIGEYWTYSSNDSVFLVCAFDNKGDTIFNQGDTMTAMTYLIYSLNDSLLSIRGCNNEQDKFKNNIWTLKKD